MELLSAERVSLNQLKMLLDYFEELQRDFEIIASIKESWLPFTEERIHLTEGFLEILKGSDFLEKRVLEAFSNLKRAFSNLKKSINSERLEECVRLTNYILRSLREITRQKESSINIALISFTKTIQDTQKKGWLLFTIGIPIILFLAYLIVIESKRMNLTLINYLKDMALKVKTGSFPVTVQPPIFRLPEGEKLASYIGELINQVNESVKRINELSEARISFLAIASHELKTPLTSIIGYSEILLEKGFLSQEEKKTLNIINSQAHKLLNTIERMLIYSALDTTLNIETIDLREIIFKLKEEFKTKIKEKGITFKIEVPDKEVVLKSDHYRIEIALKEILDNAIKFTSEGEVIFAVKDKGESIIIEIEDNGPGIEESKKKLIFELFTQGESFLKRRHEGIGLGLPLALRALSGIGSLGFENKEKGSKFYIKIPKKDIEKVLK